MVTLYLFIIWSHYSSITEGAAAHLVCRQLCKSLGAGGSEGSERASLVMGQRFQPKGLQVAMGALGNGP